MMDTSRIPPRRLRLWGATVVVALAIGLSACTVPVDGSSQSVTIVNNCPGKVTASAAAFPADREATEDDARGFVLWYGSVIEPGSSFEDPEAKMDLPILVSIQGESGEIWFQVFDLEDLKPVFELSPGSGNCPG